MQTVVVHEMLWAWMMMLKVVVHEKFGFDDSWDDVDDGCGS